MASHRRPGSTLNSLLPRRSSEAPRSPAHRAAPGALPRGTTAATLALASLTAVTVLQGTGHADPQPSTAQVKSRVDALHREAERATQEYNGARERADSAERRLDDLRDQAARRTQQLNRTRDSLGAFAAAQYRRGAIAPGFQLALSSKPDEFLDRAALAERAGAQQASAVDRIGRQLRGVRQLRTEAARTAKSLDASRAEAHRRKQSVQHKLDSARTLLDRLTAAQRARVLDEQPDEPADSPSAGAAPAHAARATARDTGAQAVPAAASGPRATRAVSFARGALGKPYAWGASGPSGYDCSGLTQAAWKSAGVSLPRTTYAQIKAGRRVERSQLAPGDLVFFYRGVTHVGLYVGGGKMIHAPRPGTSVKVASISEMPYAGAVRPG